MIFKPDLQFLEDLASQSYILIYRTSIKNDLINFDSPESYRFWDNVRRSVKFNFTYKCSQLKIDLFDDFKYKEIIKKLEVKQASFRDYRPLTTESTIPPEFTPTEENSGLGLGTLAKVGLGIAGIGAAAVGLGMAAPAMGGVGTALGGLTASSGAIKGINAMGGILSSFKSQVKGFGTHSNLQTRITKRGQVQSKKPNSGKQEDASEDKVNNKKAKEDTLTSKNEEDTVSNKKEKISESKNKSNKKETTKKMESLDVYKLLKHIISFFGLIFSVLVFMITTLLCQGISISSRKSNKKQEIPLKEETGSTKETIV